MLSGWLILTGRKKVPQFESSPKEIETESFTFPFRTESKSLETCSVELLLQGSRVTAIISAAEGASLETIGQNYLEIARQLYLKRLSRFGHRDITWKLRLKRN